MEEKDKLRSFYDNVSSYLDIGSYDDFYGAMQDPQRRQKFYDATSQYVDIGDSQKFNSFIGDYFGSQEAPARVDVSDVEDAEQQSMAMAGSAGQPPQTGEGNMMRFHQTGKRDWSGYQQKQYEQIAGQVNAKYGIPTQLSTENYATVSQRLADLDKEYDRIAERQSIFLGDDIEPSWVARDNARLASLNEERDALRAYKTAFGATDERQTYEQRVGSVLDAIDKEGVAERAWENAGVRTMDEQKQNADKIWDNYASMGGGPENRMMSTGEMFHGNQVSRLKYHDLQRMADEAWNMLGEEKQQEIVDGIYGVLKDYYPDADEQSLREASEKMARQQSNQRMFDVAVEKNAPKNALDLFFRKAVGMNSLLRITEGLARSSAGTTGDWEAREVAEQNANRGWNKAAGIGGTVIGMAFDPTVWLSGGLSGAATKGLLGGYGRRFGAAKALEFANSLKGKVASGALGGAVNLGTYEAANEAIDQFRWGGEILGADPETGRYNIGDYNVGKVAGRFGHGLLMGTSIGVIAPTIGNVSEKLVNATDPTLGKLGLRAGELAAGTVAEGTVFAAPEFMSIYSQYGDMIASLSDENSPNYIADPEERSAAMEKLVGERKGAMLDAWTDSMAMMAGFKGHSLMKSAPKRISELSMRKPKLSVVRDEDGFTTGYQVQSFDAAGNPHSMTYNTREAADEAYRQAKRNMGFETRLRYILDGHRDLALTSDEKAELNNRGYTDLNNLVEDYTDFVKQRGEKKENAEVEQTELPYNRFIDLMTDPSVSESARAKMYYYITGNVLPMSTVMASSPITEVKDQNGKTIGYQVQSIGMNNNVITSKTFKTEKAAEAEKKRIDRQTELNSVDFMEKVVDSMDEEQRGRDSETIRKEIFNKYFVDVDKALAKEPSRRSKVEQQAVDEYNKSLYNEYHNVSTEEQLAWRQAQDEWWMYRRDRDKVQRMLTAGDGLAEDLATENDPVTLKSAGHDMRDARRALSEKIGEERMQALESMDGNQLADAYTQADADTKRLMDRWMVSRGSDAVAEGLSQRSVAAAGQFKESIVSFFENNAASGDAQRSKLANGMLTLVDVDDRPYIVVGTHGRMYTVKDVNGNAMMVDASQCKNERDISLDQFVLEQTAPELDWYAALAEAFNGTDYTPGQVAVVGEGGRGKQVMVLGVDSENVTYADGYTVGKDGQVQVVAERTVPKQQFRDMVEQWEKQAEQDAKRQASLTNVPVSQMEAGMRFPVEWRGEIMTAEVVEEGGKKSVNIVGQDGTVVERGIDDFTDEDWQAIRTVAPEPASDVVAEAKKSNIGVGDEVSYNGEVGGALSGTVVEVRDNGLVTFETPDGDRYTKWGSLLKVEKPAVEEAPADVAPEQDSKPVEIPRTESGDIAHSLLDVNDKATYDAAVSEEVENALAFAKDGDTSYVDGNLESARQAVEVAEKKTPTSTGAAQRRAELETIGNERAAARKMVEFWEEVSKEKSKKVWEDLQNQKEVSNFAANPEKQQEWVDAHHDDIVNGYIATYGNKLDPDEVRKAFRPMGYDGMNVADFNKQESRLVNEIYSRMLRDAVESGNPSVTILTGVGGAGKSTATRNMDLSGRGLVFDSALNKPKKLAEAIKKAKDAGMKDIQVVAVKNDAPTAFENTLRRGLSEGRFLPLEYFTKAYQNNQGKIDVIREKYPDVEIVSYDNSGNKGREREDGGKVPTDDAARWDYTIDDETLSKLLDIYENGIDQGRFTEDQAAAIGRGLHEITWSRGSRAAELDRRISRIERRVRRDGDGLLRSEVSAQRSGSGRGDLGSSSMGDEGDGGSNQRPVGQGSGAEGAGDVEPFDGEEPISELEKEVREQGIVAPDGYRLAGRSVVISDGGYSFENADGFAIDTDGNKWYTGYNTDDDIDNYLSRRISDGYDSSEELLKDVDVARKRRETKNSLDAKTQSILDNIEYSTKSSSDYDSGRKKAMAILDDIGSGKKTVEEFVDEYIDEQKSPLSAEARQVVEELPRDTQVKVLTGLDNQAVKEYFGYVPRIGGRFNSEEDNAYRRAAIEKNLYVNIFNETGDKSAERKGKEAIVVMDKVLSEAKERIAKDRAETEKMNAELMKEYNVGDVFEDSDGTYTTVVGKDSKSNRLLVRGHRKSNVSPMSPVDASKKKFLTKEEVERKKNEAYENQKAHIERFFADEKNKGVTVQQLKDQIKRDKSLLKDAKKGVSSYSDVFDIRRIEAQIEVCERVLKEKQDAENNAKFKVTKDKRVAERFDDLEDNIREAQAEGNEARVTELNQEKAALMQKYLDGIKTEDATVVTRNDCVEVLKRKGAKERHVQRVEKALEIAKRRHQSIGGFYVPEVGICINSEDIHSIDEGRTSYVHERQHDLTKKDLSLRDAVADAASLDELRGYVALLSETHFYDDADIEEVAEEFISFAMEVAYSTDNVEEGLRQRGVDNENLIQIIKQLDDEQRTETSLSKARRGGGRDLYGDGSGRGDYQQDGRDSQGRPSEMGTQGSRPSGGSGQTIDLGRGSQVDDTVDGAEDGNTVLYSPEDLEAAEVTQRRVEDVVSEKIETESVWSNDKTLTPEAKQLLTSVDLAMYGAPEEASDSEVRFSYTREPDIRRKSQAFFEKAKDDLTFGEETFDVCNAVVQTMVDIFNEHADDEFDGVRVLPPDDVIKGQNTIFKNGSYGRTMENTTKCLRTLAYNDFVDAVKENLGRPMSTGESFLASQMLYDIAVDPQCLYCYVSLDRKAYDEFLLRYIQQRDAVLAEYNASGIDRKLRLKPQTAKKGERKGTLGDSPLEQIYSRYLDGREDSPDQRRRFNLWIANADKGLVTSDILATESRRNAAIEQGGDIEKQVRDAQRYAQAASWAKVNADYRAYNGEILRLGQGVIDKLKQEYGLRFYSFSEYSPAFIVENMQMIRDAALRALNGLAYTKEVDFAKIFAPSGININVSCFGRKADDGTIVMDTRQGADWNEVQELRKQYPNVGAVFVATDDEQAEWALNQPWIDVVIPFHIVRTGSEVADFYGWINHTAMQADVDTRGHSRDIMPTEHHNDKERFLELCKERGLKPRFADMKLSNGESVTTHPNYMKLVNETRRSIDETVPLHPIFDLQAAEDSFATFVEKGGYYGGWWATDPEGVREAVKKVADDIRAGKNANEVEYGRQNISFNPEVLLKLARRARANKSHGNIPLHVGDEIAAPNVKEDEGTRFRVTDQQDADYMDAVNRGDMDTAQRMVMDAFKAKFPDTKVVDENGNPLVVYHGTPNAYFFGNAYTGATPFTVFDEKKRGKNTMAHDAKNGFFFTPDERFASYFRTRREYDPITRITKESGYSTSNLYAVFLNMGNPLDLRNLSNEDAEIVRSMLPKYAQQDFDVDDVKRMSRTKNGSKELQIYLARNIDSVKANGYDGVINYVEDDAKRKNVEYEAFTPNQIKSADPVTYDNDGNVIPLSQRFNDQNDDIRFRVTEEEDKSFARAYEENDTEKAMQMVADAAAKAMPNTKVVGEDGKPLVVHHGTTFEFTKFDRSKADPWWWNYYGDTFYFTDNSNDSEKNYAGGGSDLSSLIDAYIQNRVEDGVDYEDAEKEAENKFNGGKNINMSVFLDMKNPVVIEGDNNKWQDKRDELEGRDFAAYIESLGYDGIIDRNAGKRFSNMGIDNNTTHYMVFNPSQIKSADPFTFDDDGNLIPLSERFNDSNDDIRFRVTDDEERPIFVSNAARAVEGIKQEKATPEQWLKMIEKNGGLKAGEDKWLGLSQWLKDQANTDAPRSDESLTEWAERNRKKTLTKQEVLDFINENAIRIEEVRYSDDTSVGKNILESNPQAQERFNEMQDEYKRILADEKEKNGDTWVAYVKASDRLDEKYPNSSVAYDTDDDGNLKVKLGMEKKALEALGLEADNPINATRLNYTTEGLDNKREIALTVPTIEPWNESDDVHFGDAGEGRAVAWIRFGDTTDDDGKRVLVIDEIQSKRHQDARENGYKTTVDEADKDFYDFIARTKEKYHYTSTTPLKSVFTDEEMKEYNRLNRRLSDAYNNEGIPEAPFEKNWHELAMKRMLRYAAENGYDKVAWTTGDQQAERYDLGEKISSINVSNLEDGTKLVTLNFRNRAEQYEDLYQFSVNNDGRILKGDFAGKELSDVVGKDMSKKIMGVDQPSVSFSGDDLRVGTEGMKGFYDRMLPSFMDKYGKKWGVKVGEVTLPNLEEGYQTMHSIDVTDAMKESVKDGQVMFRVTDDDAAEPIDEKYDAGVLSRREMLAETLLDMAQRNKDDNQAKMDAIRAVASALNETMKTSDNPNFDIAMQDRSVASVQRTYDKATVDGIVRLARLMSKSDLFKDFSRGEVNRLLTLVKNAAGRKDISQQANKVADMMLQHAVKEMDGILKKQLNVKGAKTNAQGVMEQGRLDLQGQRMVDAMKRGMELDDASLQELIDEANDGMGSDNESKAANAAVDYQGYMLAKQYIDDIKASKAEEDRMRDDIRKKEQEVKDGELDRKAYNEFVSETERAIRENKSQRIQAYGRLLTSVGQDIRDSFGRAKAFREAQMEHVNEIHHNANSDLEGMPSSEHSTADNKLINSSAARFLLRPVADFDEMLRFLGRKSVDGKGYLFNRFMPAFTKASDTEHKNKYADHQELDAKVSDVFGRKMRWSDLFAVEGSLPTINVRFRDGGEMKDHELTQGKALYVYMVNKMTDGRMKLRAMGITDDDVQAIKEQLDPRFVELADWVQGEFLPKLRERYNEVHTRMFGAPMDAIEDYFRLEINDRSRGREMDISAPENDMRPSTVTGSIKKRVKNSTALDLTNTDAFDMLLGNIDEMEHWAAFAEFNRDINILLSYNKFRNRVMNMTSGRFGSGETLWNNFVDAARIVAGVYQPKVRAKDLDNALVNMSKGVTAAKISFRLYTALKQLLSYPAYLSEASPVELVKSSNPVGAVKSWNWAMENLPGFAKRWQSRQAGDTRLKETDVDWQLWKNKIIETAGRLGMTPNAFVDAMTVAMGSKAVYETALKRYMNDGYSKEAADEKAKMDASLAYNETQQSSEAAYISGMQLDRTLASVALTVFRNASMAYERRFMRSLANMKKMMRKGFREENMEYAKKQMMRDGLSEEQAEDAAKRSYRRAWAKNAADLAIFGWVLQFAWNLGSDLMYLLFGKDDDMKDEMLKDAALHAVAGGVEGLSGGNIMSEYYNTMRKRKEYEDKYGKAPAGQSSGINFTTLPIMSDIKTTLQHFDQDDVRGINDIVNLVIQAGVGVNPQTITDAVVAIVDATNGDMETGKEIGMLLMRLAQVPQSQVDNIYIDELGMTAKDAKNMDVDAMAKRYARYKNRRDTFFTGWMYDEGEREKAEDRYAKRFDKKIQERIQAMDDDELTDALEDANPEMKQKFNKEYASRQGISYTKSSTEYGAVYDKLVTPKDISEDAVLRQAKKDAKETGDDRLYKEIDSFQRQLTNIKKGASYHIGDVKVKDEDSPGLGKGEKTDESVMRNIRKQRELFMKRHGLTQ